MLEKMLNAPNQPKVNSLNIQNDEGAPEKRKMSLLQGSNIIENQNTLSRAIICSPSQEQNYVASIYDANKFSSSFSTAIFLDRLSEVHANLGAVVTLFSK